MTTTTQQNERPILFSTPMVEAIIEGRKTQTRRLVNPQPDDDGLWNDTDFPRSIQSTLKGWNGTTNDTGESREWRCPYGETGDILWVREKIGYHQNDKASPHKYRTDVVEEEAGFYKWKPSIHMPKEAARIWLQITKVAVEHIQDITEQDAIAEGVEFMQSYHLNGKPSEKLYKDYQMDGMWFTSAYFSFESLWNSINGERSWQKNPWVWVVAFKVLSTTGKP